MAHSEFPFPKATLQRFELRPKRSFGQNFLADQQLVERIALLCGSAPARVVEIGAGLGSLTHCLLARSHHVVAIERDRDLLPVLRQLFEQPLSTGQLQLLEADAKQIDWALLFASKEGALGHLGSSSPRVLAGNLPYQITGPLLENAVAARAAFDLGVFLVQKEVADRLSAAPGSKSYGALSVFCQAAFDVRREFIVRRGAFYPQPNVDSAVVTLACSATPRAVETPAFRAVVKAAFHERRKVLRNAWSGVWGASRDELEQCAKDAAVSLEARGETLGVSDFARMAERLQQLPRGKDPADV